MTKQSLFDAMTGLILLNTFGVEVSLHPMFLPYPVEMATVSGVLAVSNRLLKQKMKKYCLAVDLKDDPSLIQEYEMMHKKENTWPEIIKSISDSGITNMEIYRTGNRLFMIMETEDSFSFEQKAAMDNSNTKVQEWEQLMWSFQQSLPWAKENEKWVLMNMIFEL